MSGNRRRRTPVRTGRASKRGIAGHLGAVGATPWTATVPTQGFRNPNGGLTVGRTGSRIGRGGHAVAERRARARSAPSRLKRAGFSVGAAWVLPVDHRDAGDGCARDGHVLDLSGRSGGLADRSVPEHGFSGCRCGRSRVRVLARADREAAGGGGRGARGYRLAGTPSRPVREGGGTGVHAAACGSRRNELREFTVAASTARDVCEVVKERSFARRYRRQTQRAVELAVEELRKNLRIASADPEQLWDLREDPLDAPLLSLGVAWAPSSQSTELEGTRPPIPRMDRSRASPIPSRAGGTRSKRPPRLLKARQPALGTPETANGAPPRGRPGVPVATEAVTALPRI